MDTWEVFQAWLRYFAEFWFVRGIAMIAIFWIFMQILPNSWAGGRLFDRKFAWISCAVAATIVCLVFVVPWISWQLLVGIIATACLAGLSAFMRSKWS